MDANGEDQERLLHSRSPEQESPPSPLLIGVYLRSLAVLFPPVGFTDSGPPFQPDEERFHVLQRRALRVTEAKPLINANGREWKRIKRGCFTVVQREQESPP